MILYSLDLCPIKRLQLIATVQDPLVTKQHFTCWPCKRVKRRNREFLASVKYCFPNVSSARARIKLVSHELLPCRRTWQPWYLDSWSTDAWEEIKIKKIKSKSNYYNGYWGSHSFKRSFYRPDVFYVVAGKFEYVCGDIFEDCHNVEGHLGGKHSIEPHQSFYPPPLPPPHRHPYTYTPPPPPRYTSPRPTWSSTLFCKTSLARIGCTRSTGRTKQDFFRPCGIVVITLVLIQKWQWHWHRWLMMTKWWSRWRLEWCCQKTFSTADCASVRAQRSIGVGKVLVTWQIFINSFFKW